jgi:hypothetical protein
MRKGRRDKPTEIKVGYKIMEVCKYIPGTVLNGFLLASAKNRAESLKGQLLVK